VLIGLLAHSSMLRSHKPLRTGNIHLADGTVPKHPVSVGLTGLEVLIISYLPFSSDIERCIWNLVLSNLGRRSGL
jgi:hypothetical protein